MQIQCKKGYAINQDADVVVNSANGFLLLGTSGAGRIRELSEKLSKNEKEEYEKLLNKLPKKTREWYEKMYRENEWTPTYAQLSSLKLLLKNNGELKKGAAILDKNWSKKNKKKVIHAVAMSYDLNTGKRKKATVGLIKKAARNAFKIAESIKAKTIAIPVMAARKSYGVTPEESFDAIMSVNKEFKNSGIKKAIICFDNRRTQDYLDKIR